MSKTTIEQKTIERAYFHVSNGGLTIAVEEELHERQNCPIFPPDWHEGLRSGKYKAKGDPGYVELPTETRYSRYWFLKLSNSNHGVVASYRFPLTPIMVEWGIHALTRFLVRMQTPLGMPTDGDGPEPLRAKYCDITAVDGAVVKTYWPADKAPKYTQDSSD